jgi:hypothetical protein
LGIILISFSTFFFLGPIFLQYLYWTVVLLVHLFLATNAARLATGMVITTINTRKHLDIDWNHKMDHWLFDNVKVAAHWSNGVLDADNVDTDNNEGNELNESDSQLKKDKDLEMDISEKKGDSSNATIHEVAANLDDCLSDNVAQGIADGTEVVIGGDNYKEICADDKERNEVEKELNLSYSTLNIDGSHQLVVSKSILPPDCPTVSLSKYITVTQDSNFVHPDQVRQIIIIPNYNENWDILCETIEILANHGRAKSSYKLIMAMEEGEENHEIKAKKLISVFGKRFFSMRYSAHPRNIPGEAAGKSSNVAWAALDYANNISTDEDALYDLITVMDADTHLSEKYFDCLVYRYCTALHHEKQKMLFAPTLIFDRNANEVPFLVRMTDFCWTIGLLSIFQMPVKFPCSVYTVSRLLAHRVKYWDAGPEAIGEDMHMSLKCWTYLQMELIMIPIYIPASSSNVQGDTYIESLWARFEQAKRHLWGALDFGYAFSSLISHKCYQKHAGKCLLILYLLFEMFFQPFFGFYHISGQYIFPDPTFKFGIFCIEHTAYIRLSLVPLLLVVAFAYERYHLLACNYRASILRAVRIRKEQESVIFSVDDGKIDLPSSTISTNLRDEPGVAFRKWYHITDWAGLPFALVVYYMIPGVHAMIKQMWTNHLDYKVSLKPTVKTTSCPEQSIIEMQDTSVDEIATSITTPTRIY